MPAKVMANTLRNSQEFPRLSTYLRTCANLVPPQNDVEDYKDLSNKRKQLKEKSAKLFNLKTLKEFLSHNSSCSSSEIDDSMKQLMLLAKEIVGSESSSEVIEGSAIFLLELFRDCSIIGQKEKLQLRRMFGTYSTSAVAKAFEITKNLIDHLNLDVQESILKNGFPKHSDGLLNEEFGSKIKFVGISSLDDSFFCIPFNEVEDKEEKESVFKNLSFKFEAQLETKPEPVVERAQIRKQKFDQRWLQARIQESFSSLDDTGSIAADLTISVMQLLKSPKSSDELQEELCELLGFERIDLMPDIIQHRDEIVHSKIISQADLNAKDRSATDKRPTCMTQVVIQVD